MVKRKICYFSKYMKISVKILFPFVLIGIIPERKGGYQGNIQMPIKDHTDLDNTSTKRRE